VRTLWGPSEDCIVNLWMEILWCRGNGWNELYQYPLFILLGICDDRDDRDVWRPVFELVRRFTKNIGYGYHPFPPFPDISIHKFIIRSSQSSQSSQFGYSDLYFMFCALFRCQEIKNLKNGLVMTLWWPCDNLVSTVY
jgi:hypothetical protein